MIDYRTHPDWAALCRAIGALPADDTVRLVAADWLDETQGTVKGPCATCDGEGHCTDITPSQDVHQYACPDCGGNGSRWVSDGRAERAAFIRVQCRLAGLEADLAARVAADWDVGQAGLEEQIDALHDESESLLAEHYHHWFPQGFSWMDWPKNGSVCEWLSRRVFRRGFIDTVRGPLAALLGEECENCGGFGEFRRRHGNGDGPEGPCPDCGGKWNSGPHDDPGDYWDKGTGRTPGALERMGPELLAVRACEITDLLAAESLWTWRGCHFVYRSAESPAFEEGVNAECVVRDGDLYDEVCELADYADNSAAGFVGQSHAGSARVWPDAARDALSRAVLAVARRRAGLGQPESEATL